LNAAARLTRRLLDSGSRRVAFVGLAKNAGKTTALVAVLEELARRGVPAGATSAGRDGEDFDALTGEPKPRFRLWPGQLAASAESTFSAGALAALPLERLPFDTRFGAVVVQRISEPGELEMIGPTTASQTSQAAAALERHGARVVLLDGAFGRRAFASARVADGVVLAVGMSAGANLETVLSRARSAAELVALGPAPPGRPVRSFDGALTDESLRGMEATEGLVLVARDFASIFLTESARRALAEQGVALAVARPSRLLAVTANPSAPGRPGLPARDFFGALGEALPGAALYDLQADLVREPEATSAP
jgi:hypothetical protein